MLHGFVLSLKSEEERPEKKLYAPLFCSFISTPWVGLVLLPHVCPCVCAKPLVQLSSQPGSLTWLQQLRGSQFFEAPFTCLFTHLILQWVVLLHLNLIDRGWYEDFALCSPPNIKLYILQIADCAKILHHVEESREEQRLLNGR